MRNNQPVTQKEQDFSADVRIISMTDLQGDITFVNRDFIQLSGFTEEELIGLNCQAADDLAAAPDSCLRRCLTPRKRQTFHWRPTG